MVVAVFCWWIFRALSWRRRRTLLVSLAGLCGQSRSLLQIYSNLPAETCRPFVNDPLYRGVGRERDKAG